MPFWFYLIVNYELFIHLQGSNKRLGRELKVLRIHRSNMSTSAGSGLKGSLKYHRLIIRVALCHHVTVYVHI